MWFLKKNHLFVTFFGFFFRVYNPLPPKITPQTLPVDYLWLPRCMASRCFPIPAEVEQCLKQQLGVAVFGLEVRLMVQISGDQVGYPTICRVLYIPSGPEILPSIGLLLLRKTAWHEMELSLIFCVASCFGNIFKVENSWDVSFLENRIPKCGKFAGCLLVINIKQHEWWLQNKRQGITSWRSSGRTREFKQLHGVDKTSNN